MEKEQYEIMRRLEDHMWWYVGMRRITASVLAPLVGGARGWRVLDAGCGTGANLDFFASCGEVVGIDIADDGLRHCRARGHARICLASIERLPFAAESFDLVSSFDVIYHRAVRDDLLALREFYRVLRPGGRVVLRVPAYDWLRGAHDAAVHTGRRYTAREVRCKLSLAGFRASRVTYANCLLFPAAVAKRLAEGRGVGLAADLSEPRPLPNRLLTGILGIEAGLLRHVDLPWGLSVVAIGVKDCATDASISG